MSTSLAKKFYLEQIKPTKGNHRKIANRIAARFEVSPAGIRNELLEGGYIKLVKVVPMGETKKNHDFYALTKKKFTYTEEIEEPKSSVEQYWPCGTKKSTGNAFDLSVARGLFPRSELAASSNKGKPQNYNTPVQVIAYSRA